MVIEESSSGFTSQTPFKIKSFVLIGKNDVIIFGFRDVAQSGSVLRSGRRGRWFESSHPDFARRSLWRRRASLVKGSAPASFVGRSPTLYCLPR